MLAGAVGYPGGTAGHAGSAPLQTGVALLRAMPPWLAGIWGAWLIAVSVNVVIWLIVSVSASDGPVYFWPIWVAGPWGAVLAATSVIGALRGEPQR